MYREVEYFDETAQDTARVLRADWYGVDEQRLTEYMAAQLVDRDYHSGLVWQIIEARRSDWRHAQEAYELALRRVYSTYRRFCTRFRGMANSIHVDLTARQLGLTTREVYAALRDAELFRVDQLVAEVA